MDAVFDIWKNGGLGEPLDPLPDFEDVMSEMNTTHFVVQRGSYWIALSCGYYGTLGRPNQMEYSSELGVIPGLVNAQLMKAGGSFEGFGRVYYNRHYPGGTEMFECTSTDSFIGASASHRDRPNLLRHPYNIRQVAMGGGHALFLDADKRVWSSGRNDSGQAGRGTSSLTVTMGPVGGLPPIKKVEANEGTSFFLAESGEVYTSGASLFWSDISSPHAYTLSPVPINGLSGVADVVADRFCVYFIKGNGDVLSGGSDDFGLLGRDGPGGTLDYVNVSGVIKVVARDDTVFFLDGAGRVWSAGDNSHGQLGRQAADAGTGRTNLGLITGLPPVDTVMCGQGFAAFMTPDKRIFNCGDNDRGYLARNVPTGSADSTNLGELAFPNAKKMCCGNGNFFVINTNHEFFGCGTNSLKELGDASIPPGTAAQTNFTKLNI
jgi:alpha-tubulin suppressor-like RCC1 family protein